MSWLRDDGVWIFSQKLGINFSHFRLKYPSSLEFRMFLDEATLSSLLITPQTKALHNAFNIGLPGN